MGAGAPLRPFATRPSQGPGGPRAVRDGRRLRRELSLARAPLRAGATQQQKGTKNITHGDVREAWPGTGTRAFGHTRRVAPRRRGPLFPRPVVGRDFAARALLWLCRAPCLRVPLGNSGDVSAQPAVLHSPGVHDLLNNTRRCRERVDGARGWRTLILFWGHRVFSLRPLFFEPCNTHTFAVAPRVAPRWALGDSWPSCFMFSNAPKRHTSKRTEFEAVALSLGKCNKVYCWRSRVARVRCVRPCRPGLLFRRSRQRPRSRWNSSAIAPPDRPGSQHCQRCRAVGANGRPQFFFGGNTFVPTRSTAPRTTHSAARRPLVVRSDCRCFRKPPRPRLKQI